MRRGPGAHEHGVGRLDHLGLASPAATGTLAVGQNAVGPVPVGVVHRHDLVGLVGEVELDGVVAGDEAGPQEPDADRHGGGAYRAAGAATPGRPPARYPVPRRAVRDRHRAGSARGTDLRGPHRSGQHHRRRAARRCGGASRSLPFEWISIWDHFYAADGTSTNCLEAVVAHTALAMTTSRSAAARWCTAPATATPACWPTRSPPSTSCPGAGPTSGIGAGWLTTSTGPTASPSPAPGERLDLMEEYIRCVRGLLHDRTSASRGEYFTLTDAVVDPRPVQTGCRSGSAAAASNARCGSWRSSPTAGTCRSSRPRTSPTSVRCSTTTARRSAATRRDPLLGQRGVRPHRGVAAAPVRRHRRVRAARACWCGSAPGDRRPHRPLRRGRRRPGQHRAARPRSRSRRSSSSPSAISGTGRAPLTARSRRAPCCPDLRRRPADPQAHRHRRARARAGRTCPSPAARSAPAGSRRPSPTTCGGSPTGGRPCPTAAARWCCTHRTTTPSSGRSAVPAPAGWSTCGPSAPRRSAPATTSTTCWCSRTAAPRSGATIAHPHGQIYAYPSAAGAAAGAASTACSTAERRRRRAGACASHGDWRAWVPEAASWPYELRLAPRAAVPDLRRPTACDRDGLAAALVDGLARLDQLFDAPMPYMLWIHQRPTDGGDWPGARLHVHVAPLLPRAGRAALRRRGRAGRRRCTSTRSTPTPAAARPAAPRDGA